MVRSAIAICALVTLGAAASWPAPARADYPDRPIRLVVPFPAGGANDVVARLIQPGLEKALGQPIIIDNRPAASGVVGSDQVAKSSPDGYTLLMAVATHAVNPAVNPKLPFDSERDFAPIVLIGKSPLLFIVNPQVPAKTLAEFIALAKAQPGKLNYATPGPASQAHLLIAWWSQLAGIEMQHIPYKGGAPAVLGTVAGETQFTVMTPLASLSQIQSGMLRSVAIGSLERDPHLANIPTVSESGFPGFEAVSWFGLMAAANTPRPIVDRINAEVNRIIADPQFREKLAEQGTLPGGGTPEAFGKFVSEEIKRWREAARIANVSASQ